MRITLVVSVVAVSVAFLAGCGSDDVSESEARLSSAQASYDATIESIGARAPVTVVPSDAPMPPPLPAPSSDPYLLDPDDSYIEGLDAGNIEYADAASMRELGRGICADLTKGTSLETEMASITIGSNGKWGEADAGYIIGSAMSAYCPQFESLIPG
ncbi:DUF732 domain-containing protein [Rhodococcoides fascians]|uniref:DUF732 domain-containing protein n=1 Tax=Rhodococcoides fascians TaxID=1828 RepID=UPI00068C03A5|nr:DUF732 domain-containing protein [Rhodococcus fascians]